MARKKKRGGSSRGSSRRRGSSKRSSSKKRKRSPKTGPRAELRRLSRQIAALKRIGNKPDTGAKVRKMGTFRSTGTRSGLGSHAGYQTVGGEKRAAAIRAGASYKARKAAQKKRVKDVRAAGKAAYGKRKKGGGSATSGGGFGGSSYSSGGWTPNVAVPRAGTWATARDYAGGKKRKSAPQWKRHTVAGRPGDGLSFGERMAMLRVHGGGGKKKRDWKGEPIRHARASALGWQRKFRKSKRKYPGKRPENPTFGGHRPVKSSARRDFQTRDWEGQPIRHARARALGWQRQFRKSKRKWPGKRPQNPSFHGHRPVRSTASRDHGYGGGGGGYQKKRDWPGEKKRHAYAAAWGWQKRFRKNRSEFPGHRPARNFFRGARPVKSTLRQWPPPRKSGGGGGRDRDYKHRVYGGVDMRDRDWEGQPVRHARASTLGWQRRFSSDRRRKRGRKYPGKRPENPSFFGHRPVKSSARRDSRY